MGSLFEWITDWIKEGLIDAITGQYTSIFNSVNNQVADVANQVGQTPQGWNGGVFSMIQNLSETVVIPIAGMILTFVLVYALGEIDLETYRTRKAVYDTELVQAKNVHAVITAQTKQIKSDYEIKLKQQEIVQEVGNANMLTKALIDRLINKVYVFPGDRIEIEYATQDFLETKQSEKEV